jgi:hypothetical protein
MKNLKPFAWYTVAIAALGLTAAAYLRPDMILAAWGVIGLCFS